MSDLRKVGMLQGCDPATFHKGARPFHWKISLYALHFFVDYWQRIKIRRQMRDYDTGRSYAYTQLSLK